MQPVDISFLEQIDLNLYLDSPYVWIGRKVPRTTHVLSMMLHEDFLMYWSNSLGWKRQGYKKTLDSASNMGTKLHSSIETFLLTGDKEYIVDRVLSYEENKKVHTAFNNFLNYYDMLIRNGHKVEVLFVELPLICPYFGGTCDAVLRIDGKIFIYDWKSSNHLSYKYPIQLSTYKFILENYLYIPIDGICVLRLSKTDNTYEELFFDLHVEQDSGYIDDCFNLFCNLLIGYYQRTLVEFGFSNRMK